MASITATAYVHIKNTRKCVAELCGEGSRKEIGIAEYLITQGCETATAEACNIGKMIGIGDLHAFHTPLQEFGRIPSNYNTIIPHALRHSCKRGYQPGRIIRGTGITPCLLYTEHPAAKSHVVNRFLLVDSGMHNYLFEYRLTFNHLHFDECFFTATDKQFFDDYRLVADKTYMDIITSYRNPT